MAPKIEKINDSTDLQKLRDKCLESKFKLKPRLDDEFLLRSLRVRSYDVDKALKTSQDYYACIHKNYEYLFDVEPAQFTAGIYSGTVLYLNGRSQGRRVSITRVRNWDTKSVRAKEVQMVAFYTGEYVTRDTLTQEAGIELVFDCSGISTSHIYNFTYKDIKQTIGAIQGGIPVKICGLHVVNPHYLVGPIINVFLRLLTKKLRERFHVHRDLADLHKFIDPEILPREFGGKLDDTTAYDTKLMEHIVKDNVKCQDFWTPLEDLQLDSHKQVIGDKNLDQTQ